MIEVENLSFSYNEKTGKILDDISFREGAGRLIAVLGPNGAGKSTLFKCILGFLKNYTGTIRLGGRDIRDLNRKEMARLAAYIPQAETPVFNYTVEDTVLMGTTGSFSALQSPGAEQKKTAAEAIEFLGIAHLKDRGVMELSGGERQLALLARAMAQKAKLLIMDEPTANLDYGNQQRVLANIKKMAEEGLTILLSTHNPEHALQYATHVLAVRDHKILADGEAKQILDETLIEKIYGMKVTIVDIPIGERTVRSCIPHTAVF